MRHFTIEWWSGEEDTDPNPEYEAHLATIINRLPAALQKITRKMSLHDSRIRQLELSTDTRELVIALDRSPYLRLRYRDVSKFSSSADPEKGLPGPHGYGDIGYDELDILPDGVIEHRLLMSNGIELDIQFRDFDLEVAKPS